MKSNDVNRNEFNSKLLIVLVAVTAAVCVILAVTVMVLSDKKEVTAEKNPPVDVSSEEDEQNDEAEIPSPVESEPEVTEEPQQPEAELPEQELPEQELPKTVEEPGDWNLILANPWNSIPDDFTVELAEIGGGHKVDARIVDDLNQMMKDLSLAGHSAFVCSSYRTNTKQTTLYNNEVNEYLSKGYSDEEAAIEAGKWVAVPGTSEHQTGLAVDIMSSYYMVLDEGQEDTAEQKWLMENSYKYGFILRYPNNKSEITGIYYEPWHYRYVGKDVAKEIYDRDICFEEYLGV